MFAVSRWMDGAARLVGIAALALTVAALSTGCNSEESSRGNGGHAGGGGAAGEGGSAGEGGAAGEGGSAGAGGSAGEGGSGGTVETVARVEVTPSEGAVLEGRTLSFTAKAFDADDQELTGLPVGWSAADKAIASVDATGLVTAHLPGLTTITATIGGVEGSATLAVSASTVTRVEIVAPATFVGIDATIAWAARTWDADGIELHGRSAVWSSSDETVATVDAAGRVTGLASGEATITVQVEDASADLVVEVDFAFVQLAAGGYHTCGLTAAGEAWCWGSNHSGQLGDGSTDDSAVPVRVGPDVGLEFVQLVAGEDHTCGRTTSQQIWCWGSNDDLVVSPDSEGTPYATLPVRRPEADYSAISSLAYSVCGLDSSGAAHCWGYNSSDYELGDPDFTDGSTWEAHDVSAPVEGGVPLSFRELRHGRYFSCGLTMESRLYCWGYNSDGQIGDGTTDSVARPKEPMPGETIVAFGLGEAFTCAVTAVGETWCWGDNSSHQISESDEDNLLVPTRVEVLPFVPAALALGSGHSCALDPQGIAWCGGGNWNGQLGRASAPEDQPSLPAPVDGGFSFTSLVAGPTYTCGLLADGRVRCWGEFAGD